MICALTAFAQMALRQDAGQMEGSKHVRMGVTLIPPLNLGKGMLIDVTHPPYLPRKLRKSENAKLEVSLKYMLTCEQTNFHHFTLG